MSTSYHPQTDGQTEIVNRQIEQMIRVFINHKMDNWAELLPALEFAFNDAPNQATGQTPCFLNYGFHPASSQLSLSADILQASLVPASSEFLDQFQTAIKSARSYS